MARAVGLDLGTTNSVVAASMEGGQAEVMPNAEGLLYIPANTWLCGDTPREPD